MSGDLGMEIVFNNRFIDTFPMWQSALGGEWNIDSSLYRDIFSDKQYITADLEGKTIGFVAYDFDVQQQLGSINLIVVDSEYQRQGIGGRLITEAKKSLAEKNIKRIQVCDCGFGGLWRALPKNIVGATEFFTTNGWDLNIESLDQTGSIEGYESPSYLDIRPRRQDLIFRFFEQRDKDELLDFQQKNFPHWKIYFEQFIEQGRFENIVVGHLGQEMIASCLLEYPGQRFMGSNWINMLGADCGSPSVLGVSEEHRGFGVGHYLFDFAMKSLAAKGAKHAFINQSDAPGVYKRFGFEVIWEYRQGVCEI